MSKRHKKFKMLSAGTEDNFDPFAGWDEQSQKGKRAKGRAKRASHKQAYYDM